MKNTQKIEKAEEGFAQQLELLGKKVKDDLDMGQYNCMEFLK